MLRKIAAEFETSRGPQFGVGHGWGTKEVIVQVFDVDTGEEIGVDITVPDGGNVIVTIGTPANLRAIRVVVIG